MKRPWFHWWPVDQSLFIPDQSSLYKLHRMTIITRDRHLHFHEQRLPRQRSGHQLRLTWPCSALSAAGHQRERGRRAPRWSAYLYVCMCGGLRGVCSDECCLLEKVGTGKPYIYYSPCLMHSANAELFSALTCLTPANNTLFRCQRTLLWQIRIFRGWSCYSKYTIKPGHFPLPCSKHSGEMIQIEDIAHLYI